MLRACLFDFVCFVLGQLEFSVFQSNESNQLARSASRSEQ
jgi:hypothetical protein